MATETDDLRKTIQEQAELIKQLKLAITRLERKLMMTDKRLTSVSEASRRTSQDLAKVTHILSKQRG